MVYGRWNMQERFNKIYRAVFKNIEKALKTENCQKITMEVIFRKTLVLGMAKENYIKKLS